MARIILISGDQDNRKIKTLPFSLISLFSLILIVSTVGLAFWLKPVERIAAPVTQNAASQIGDLELEADLAHYQQRLSEQERKIQNAQDGQSNQYDALGQRLGVLQAEIMRLNEIGRRLIDVSGLDEAEFDLSSEPPVGGPAALESINDSTIEDIDGALESAAAEIEDSKQRLSVLEALLASRKLHDAAYPDAWPTKGGFISSAYGYRRHPISGRREFHSGIDIANRHGAPITAIAAGIVTDVQRQSGYGSMVEIHHGNGYTTRYAHNSQVLAKKGEKVEKGQVIAKVGSSGRSTGPHLHLEVIKDGKSVDPRKHLKISG